ncbi:MAG: type II toxin-antitoxin system RelE/ParE family toxin [Roseimicrobium sp.]
MSAKIYPAARERILEVWEYTERVWGEEQADKYVRELVAAIDAIVGKRYEWRPVMDEALPGVFFFRHRHHYIFFRELSKGALGVISILHENMDIPARLSEDAERGLDD